MTIAWWPLAVLLALLAVVGWALASLLAPLALARLPGRDRAPRLRLRRLVLVAAMPWWIPMSTALAILAPASAKLAGWIEHHCESHGPGHFHLCLEHFSLLLPPGLGAAIVAVIVAGLIRALVGLLMQHRRATDRVAALDALTGRKPGVLRVVDQPRAFAVAARWPEPRIFVSSGLMSALDHRDRRIVLAHECAHLRNRDAAWTLVFDVLLLLHPESLRRRLRQAWSDALEDRVDDLVGARFGREAVAQALIRVLRLERMDPGVGFAIDAASPLARIRRLLAPPPPAFGTGFERALLLGALVLIASSLRYHHALETALGALF